MRPSTSTGKMSEVSKDKRTGQRPLSGKRILITRAAAQAKALSQPLEDLGADAIICPTIEIVPAENTTELETALAELAEIDMLILSSVNAVEFFFSFLDKMGLGPDNLQKIQVIAVGPKTARAIEANGLQVDSMPADYRAEGILDLLGDKVAGKRVLYPRAGLARDILPSRLTDAGAKVLAPVAYSSVSPVETAEKLRQAFQNGLDLLTFTASSTVRNFMQLISPEWLDAARQIPVASIGPLTSQTAREHGLQVAVEPKDSTLEAMVEAIADFFDASSSGHDLKLER
jgi:uroporphyrinogen III methyltransferase / synthase